MYYRIQAALAFIFGYVAAKFFFGPPNIVIYYMYWFFVFVYVSVYLPWLLSEFMSRYWST